MNTKRILIVFLLVLSLILSFALPAGAAEANEIVRQLLIYYSHHQENAKTDVLQLLDRLSQLDPAAAEDWRKILEVWRWAAEDLEVSWDILPDGLPQDDSLCIMVMGFKLNYGGTMDEELISRLEVALASAEKYPNAYIICTGGGTAPSNPYVTEAGQMAAWLEEQGMDPERIIVENRSTSTEENVLYSFRILSQNYPQVNSLALISSDYHLRRCYLLFTAGILLEDMPYTIVGDACFEAGYEGTHEGYLEEGKSLGKMLNMNLERTQRPELTQLTGLCVQGTTEYLAGDALDLTVTAEYDTGFTRDVTEFAEITGFDTATGGQQELQIRYTENDVTMQSTLSVQVTLPPTTAPTTEPLPSTAPTLPPATQAPAEVQEPTSGTDILVIFLFSGVLGLLILLAISRPRRGKYEKRRTR